MERATGYGPGEWIDKSLTDLLLHPDDLLSLTSLLERILGQPGSTVEGVTVRYKHKDGSWHTLEATVTNMLHDPSVNGIVANFRDVTERTTAEKALEESEQKYRALADGSIQGIVIAQGIPARIVYCNPAMAELVGYTVTRCFR